MVRVLWHRGLHEIGVPPCWLGQCSTWHLSVCFTSSVQYAGWDTTQGACVPSGWVAAWTCACVYRWRHATDTWLRHVDANWHWWRLQTLIQCGFVVHGYVVLVLGHKMLHSPLLAAGVHHNDLGCWSWLRLPAQTLSILICCSDNTWHFSIGKIIECAVCCQHVIRLFHLDRHAPEFQAKHPMFRQSAPPKVPMLLQAGSQQAKLQGPVHTVV